MKKVIILAILILMAMPAFADDPNTMERPTLQDPITICLRQLSDDPADGYEVTIKLLILNVDRRRSVTDKVSDTAIWSWINDTDFLAAAYSWYYSFPSYYERAIREMTSGATWAEGRAIYDRVESERTP